jgi:hypothetical protein
VDVRYVGYTPATESWLTALNPHGGASDEDKARMLTYFAKKYDDNDVDMSNEVQALLAHVAGNSTSAIEKWSSFVTSAAHAVIGKRARVSLLVSPARLALSIRILERRRAGHCELQGRSNCCIS